jgi:iron complex outermembrane receptor protein
LLLSATYYDSKGKNLYFPEYQAAGYGDGVAHNLDYDRAYSFFTKASYAGFTLEAAYSDRKKGIPTGAYGTLFDLPGTSTIDSQALVDLQYSGSLSEKSMCWRGPTTENRNTGLYPYRGHSHDA